MLESRFGKMKVIGAIIKNIGGNERQLGWTGMWKVHSILMEG